MIPAFIFVVALNLLQDSFLELVALARICERHYSNKVIIYAMKQFEMKNTCISGNQIVNVCEYTNKITILSDLFYMEMCHNTLQHLLLDEFLDTLVP